VRVGDEITRTFGIRYHGGVARITELDFDLATRIDTIAVAHGAN
jgi:pterin-4a-carbinolamine dehydratase